MRPLDRFIKDHNSAFNFENFFSEELRVLDSRRPPQSLFKYFSSSRVTFFGNPTIRFTQREALNDPFEMTVRWNEFASTSFQSAVASSMKLLLDKLKDNNALLMDELKALKAKEGIFLGPDEVAEAAYFLSTPAGRNHVESVFSATISQVDSVTKEMLSAAGSYPAVASDSKDFGIFSLSESCTNKAMWSLYASAGEGFVVEFDTSHPFFCAANGRSLLWPVSYNDQKQESFLQNPMALFLVKHTDYSFEREWRMVRPVAECEEHARNGSEEVHLCKIVPGMIKSVIFGYNYDANRLASDGAYLPVFFDNSIQIFSAQRIEIRVKSISSV